MGNIFEFTIPQTVICGENCLKRLPQIIFDEKCSKVFIISDKGLQKLGAVKKITDILDANNVLWETFVDVEPNPSTHTVENAAKAYLAFGAEFIVALGGGSPMDVAKAVGILANYGGNITDYEGKNTVPGPIPPVIAIPTTAGTGSETTAFSVITHTEINYKLTILSYELIPKYALLDPTLITSLPFHIAASTGIDAFIHACESYTSKFSTPFTDAMAEKAMELIGGNIRAFVADRSNLSAANNMLMGSFFAGVAFSFARLGNIHAMSHPLSAYYNIPHGVANSVLMPIVLEFNALADCGRYEKIYGYLNSSFRQGDFFTPNMLVDEVKNLLERLHIPTNLSRLGVQADKIDAMAIDSMKSGNIAANPRQTTVDDVKKLYTKAL